MASTWLHRTLDKCNGIKMGEITLMTASDMATNRIEKLLWNTSPSNDDCNEIIDYLIMNESSKYFRIKFLTSLVKTYINMSFSTAYGLNLEAIKTILDVTDTWEDEWFLILSTAVKKEYIGNNETISNYMKIIS